MAHNHLHRVHARAPEPQQQVVSIVYVTAKPTFSGAIAGYSTLGLAINTNAPQPDDLETPTPDRKTSSRQQSTLATATTLPSAISAPASMSVGTSLLAATGSPTPSADPSAASPTAGADAPTAGSSSDALSTAGKLGLTVGLLLLVGAILAILVLCYKKRRDTAKEAEAREDEKYDAAGTGNIAPPQPSARVHSTASAPRLSLRPITQFEPNLGDQHPGSGLPYPTHGLTPVPESRPATAKSTTSIPEDPFGNHAEVAPVQNPFGPHAETIDATNADGPAELDTLTIAAMPMPPSGGLQRGASTPEHGAAPMDLTKPGPMMGPPSPAGTEFSTSSASSGTTFRTSGGAAMAAAGGSANSAVHRVQLDFNPSMGDELELKQGQLIRVLHEYDDGWALCIRLDRSKQGVVPRTCLSTRPVKPRLQQPPMQNGQCSPPPGMRGFPPKGFKGPRIAPVQIRPNTPHGQPHGPESPAGPMPQGRSVTPDGPQFYPASPSGSMQPHPSSPAGSMHSSPQQRSQANSAGQGPAARLSPGPSPMNPATMPASERPTTPIRKPVPGQAL